MAKKRIRKTVTKKTGFKQVLISLGLLFTSVLFIIKIFTGSMGWLEVFAPVMIVFFIIFLLSALKTVLKRI